MKSFKLGRINANEDDAKVIDVFIREGIEVFRGDLMMVLETSKASIEIVAPSSGKIESVNVSIGAKLQYGDEVFVAAFDGDETIDSLESVNQNQPIRNESVTIPTDRKITFKAEKLAKKLGIDILLVVGSGNMVKEDDVRKYASQQACPVGGVLIRKPSIDTVPFCNNKKGGILAVIVGGGGHARSILQMVREAGYSVAGIIDSNLPIGSHFLGGYTVIGGEDELETIKSNGVLVAFIGVGGSTDNSNRVRIYENLKRLGFWLPPLISKSAAYDLSSNISEASYIFPQASVGACCDIGCNVIINQGAVVCHDCNIGDHVHLAPGAVLAGSVTVDVASTVGMAAAIMNKIRLGSNSLVHNLVAVNSNVSNDKIVTVKGVKNRF